MYFLSFILDGHFNELLSCQATVLKCSSDHNLWAQLRRHFHSFDSRNFGSVSLLEVKKFLRQKGIKYEESHACLVINIGKHHLVSSSAISAYSRCVWQNVDASMTVIYINKKTGR